MKSVRYQIKHRTSYLYSDRIDLCHSLAHLAPRDDGGLKIISHDIDVNPDATFSNERRDFLGNPTHYFSVQRSHTSLEIISNLCVEKATDSPVLPSADIAWDEMKIDLSDADSSKLRFAHFLLPTAACPRADFVKQYIQPSLVSGADVMTLAFELMGRVFSEFQFIPGVTDVNTPLQVVVERRAGVCQDFAHVMVASLRAAGIPTRYVSGYLETIPPPGVAKLKGADASHAWIEAYSPETGWVGFDPTNNKLPDSQYIKICHGRDYFDVQPVRGIFVGSGKQSLQVSVDVERVE